MKKIKILVLLLVLMVGSNYTLFSQKLQVTNNNSMEDHSLGLNYSKNIGQSEIGVGVSYIISKGSHNKIGTHDRFYYSDHDGNNFLENLQLNVFYNYYIPFELKRIEPFVFYNVNIKYSCYTVYDREVTNTQFTYGPFLYMDNSLGLGFNVKLGEKFYITPQAGSGIRLKFDNPNSADPTGFDTDFFLHFKAGVGYRF